MKHFKLFEQFINEQHINEGYARSVKYAKMIKDGTEISKKDKLMHELDMKGDTIKLAKSKELVKVYQDFFNDHKKELTSDQAKNLKS